MNNLRKDKIGDSDIYWSDFEEEKKLACLVVTTLGLELDATARHNTGRQHVAVKLLLCNTMPHFIVSKNFFT